MNIVLGIFFVSLNLKDKLEFVYVHIHVTLNRKLTNNDTIQSK